VILPTGSGKSLTYQLPSLLTRGVTVIVQPLLSLMQDQASKMTSLQLKTIQFNSNLNLNEQSSELQRLYQDKEVKMLFTSPEMLKKSEKLLETLENLYHEQRLARLVIDEAHCICQWGKDFRPDYLKISQFRERFPRVPIMALSASSTNESISEIAKNLKMKDPVLFSLGYNRPNLFYEVRTKRKTVNSDIGNFIVANHENDAGLVYCNFKSDCEVLTKVLKFTFKLKAATYHADMTKEKKEEVYRKWMGGEVNVIVGTLAFGLGIDKSNVRFVVHYSLPESLERFYQETGRAGRDGVSSNCLLFYSYDDKPKALNMKEFAKVDCYKMIEFCENQFLCRRKVLMEFFGQPFDAKECKNMCDNCKKPKEFKCVDFTSEAKALVYDLGRNRDGFSTVRQIVEVIRGSASRNLIEVKDLKSFGMFKGWSEKNLERFVRKLIFKEVLSEVPVKTQYGSYSKLIPGPLSRKLKEGSLSFEFFIKDWENKNSKLQTIKKSEVKNLNLEQNFEARLDDIDIEQLGLLTSGENSKMLKKQKNHLDEGFNVEFCDLSDEVLQNIGIKRKFEDLPRLSKQIRK
jgi:bloom syndrome protein